MSTQSAPSSLATFDDLENGFSIREVHARVLHFWEARNPKKFNSLMGLELLLLDEKSTMIQAFIPAYRIPSFEPALETLAVYSIKNFRVINNKNNYRVTAHRSRIQFTAETDFLQIKDTHTTIEMEKFWFRTFEEFDSNADTNEDLCDALGHIVLINNEQSHLDNTKGKLGIHLQLKDGPVVRLTFWAAVAMKFRESWTTMSPTPTVLLATAINPRKIGGLLYLNSTSATCFFFDKDVAATTEYFSWLNGKKDAGEKIEFPVSEVTKLESVTLAELNDFLSNKTPQTSGFMCDATIIDILRDYGWNYVGCTKCTCKLQRTATKLACKKCNDGNAVGILRYRMELSVQDKDNNTATFVIFDRDAAQLAGNKAADILEIDDKAENSIVERNDGNIPQCLLDAIGKSFTFQVKVTDYNFSAQRQTITVSRILTSKQVQAPKTPEDEGNLVEIDGSIIEPPNEAIMIKDSGDDEELLAKKRGKRAKHV